jgi:hypothetical protein
MWFALYYTILTFGFCLDIPKIVVDNFSSIDFICSGMIQKISAPISVALVYNHKTREVRPCKVLWDGKEYLIKKIGLHHTLRQGRTLFHIFSVESEALFFKLIFNTDSLSWMLEEIADGEPN